MSLRFFALVGVATMVASTAADARYQIRIVGSSTVFPFATTVAERFGNSSDFKTPVVESTGSGAGLKLFCAGLGVEHPDLTNASRRIKQSEVDLCAKNGVADITEVMIGYDGIVLANSKESALMSITLRQLFLALAKDVPANKDGSELIANPHQTWSEIDPSLPNVAIEVLGPPPTSGTRDAFAELALERGCKTFAGIKILRAKDKNRYKGICHGIREDGAYVEAGENDMLIIQKLIANPNVFGLFGFSFLHQNTDRVQGSLVGNIEPTFKAISDGYYPISRSLFFYVKDAHVGVIPGIVEYVEEFTAERAWSEDGYLADKGLIPLSNKDRQRAREKALALAPLSL